VLCHPGPVPALDLVDDTFVAATPASIAAAVHDRRRWARWWPGLELTVSRDRGLKGVQWVVCSRADEDRSRGRRVRWLGSMEIWLEPWGDGTLLHHYLRLDPRQPLAPRTARRFAANRARAWKHSVHRLKDELEGTRICGEGVKSGAGATDTAGDG